MLYVFEDRLRVHIFDTDNLQFTPPREYFPPRTPSAPGPASLLNSSDLVFNYEQVPFAFWISRRQDPGAPPLFDTRLVSLPTPSRSNATVGPSHTPVALDAFPLVFEKQYIQVRECSPSSITLLMAQCASGEAHFGAPARCECLRPRRGCCERRLQA